MIDWVAITSEESSRPPSSRTATTAESARTTTTTRTAGTAWLLSIGWSTLRVGHRATRRLSRSTTIRSRAKASRSTGEGLLHLFDLGLLRFGPDAPQFSIHILLQLCEGVGLFLGQIQCTAHHLGQHFTHSRRHESTTSETTGATRRAESTRTRLAAGRRPLWALSRLATRWALTIRSRTARALSGRTARLAAARPLRWTTETKADWPAHLLALFVGQDFIELREDFLLDGSNRRLLLLGDLQHPGQERRDEFAGTRRRHATRTSGPKAAAGIGMLILPDRFAFRGHFKDDTGIARADKRIAVRESLCSGDQHRIETRLVRSGVAPRCPFGAKGHELFSVVRAVFIQRQDDFIDR